MVLIPVIARGQSQKLLNIELVSIPLVTVDSTASLKVKSEHRLAANI